MRPLFRASLLAAAAGLAYALVVRGALTVDLGIGRRVRPLGPIAVHIAADPDTVFDVIATPYLNKTARAMEDKLRVLERGTDFVLAEHFTGVGAGFTTTTLETVRFERPHRVDFRLVRGPVPCVIESYDLHAVDGERHLLTQIGGPIDQLGPRVPRRNGNRPLAARRVVGRPGGAHLGSDRRGIP